VNARTSIFLVATLVLLLAACEEDPFRVQWEASPRQTILYALDREEIFRFSAFNIRQRAPIAIEDLFSQGQWDFAVDRQGGQMVLLPPRVLGVLSSSAIAAIPGVRFEDLRDAPSDTTLYVSRSPVPVQAGTVYVVRSHQQTDRFGQLCVFYGKIEALEVNLEQGTFRFLHDSNPECNARNLVPAGN